MGATRDAPRGIADDEAEAAGDAQGDAARLPAGGLRWLSRLAAWGAGGVPRRRHGPRQDGAGARAACSIARSWARRSSSRRRRSPSTGCDERALRAVAATDAVRRGGGPRETLAKLAQNDVLIVSYGLLARDAERARRAQFATVVLDEAQALKNATTQRAKAARALQADFRFALSGTPLENHLGELWSLYAIVFPGLLGSGSSSASASPRRSSAARTDGAARRCRACCGRSCCAARRPRSRASCRRAPNRGARRLSERERRSTRTRGSPRSPSSRSEQGRARRAAAASRCSRRSRACGCSPRTRGSTMRRSARRLVQAAAPARARRRAARPRPPRARVQPVHLAPGAGAPELEAAGFAYLPRRLDARRRSARSAVEAFQDGEADLFLISLKAGGTGLNLTAADYVIHLDPAQIPQV